MSNKLPFVQSDIPRDLRTFIDRLRELVSGSGSDRLVSASDLVNAGLADQGAGGRLLPPAQDVVATPPAPTNVTATGAVRNIIVKWDFPAYYGHAYAEVWVSSTSDFAGAVLLGSTPGAIYTHSVGAGSTRYYWVRFVNISDVVGPYNAVVGVQGVTGPEVSYLLGQLTGAITSTELSTTLNNRIGLIDGPSTTVGTIPNKLATLQSQINDITSYPTYSSTTAYAVNTIVVYQGSIYKSLSATTGNLPTNTAYWLKIGDYTSLADVVASHTSELNTLVDGLGGEITDRQALAVQLRGNYTGTDITQVAAGLVYNERQARVTNDAAISSSVTSLTAVVNGKNTIYRQGTAPTSPKVNDIWVDTQISYALDYNTEEYSVPRHKQFQWTGSEWRDITDTDIQDNFALLSTEQTTRATADSALASSITTLNTYVLNQNQILRADLQTEQTTRSTADSALAQDITTLNAQVNNVTTGLPATRATLLNDYITTANSNSAIANSKTVLKSYADVGSKVFRQDASPTIRGVDADTNANIPLRTGDVWVNTAQSNKLYQWDGSTWVYSPDTTITDSISSLNATLVNDYYTRVAANEAIAQSGTYLRAYSDNASKAFRQADPPTQRGLDPQTSVVIPLRIGDVWVDTNDGNKLYQWDSTAWQYTPDQSILDSIGAVDARVTTVETSRIGYCVIGGLASDDTNRADCQAAGGTWVQGLPIATAVKQVAVTDANGGTAVIEQAFTAQKTLNDKFKLQYTIRLDNNGYVSGYGLYNSGTISEFIVNADRFAVTSPESSIPLRTSKTVYAAGEVARVAGIDDKTLVCKVGGTRASTTPTLGAIGTKINDGSIVWQVASRVPFAVQAVPQSVNGVTLPAGVYVDAAYILNATIQTAQIADEAVDDSKIASLNVAKLTAGIIDVDTYIQSTAYRSGVGGSGFRINGDGTAELNEVTVRGTVYATDGQFTGEVISKGTGGNKARMYSGNVEIYKDVPDVGSVVYKALSRAEFGQAANNSSVTIPGYFKNQPKVIVSPADLQLYSTTYSNQNQSIQCQANDIAETSYGSMVWAFRPVATLSLAASTGNVVINRTSGTQTGSWTSPDYTTPANTSTITPSVYLASNRGNGSNQYFKRSVRWRVEYWNGSSWIAGSYTTTNLAADTAASVITTAAFTFPSAGTWTFHIYAEAYDTDGTVFGSVSYNYASGVSTAAGPATVQNYQLGTYSTSLTLSGYSVPPGYTVYSVDYAVDWAWSRNGTNGSVTVAGLQVKTSTSTGTSASGTRTYNQGSYNTSVALSIQITSTSIGLGGENLYAQISNARATVYSRQLITNSTTASNNFQLNSYTYALASAQVLATGSLNWIALGE